MPVTINNVLKKQHGHEVWKPVYLSKTRFLQT